MLKMIVFHSGNPAWRTCQMAIGVAKAMKNKFEEALDLEIYTNESEEAKRYNIMASTTVFINEEWVPLDIATSQEKLGEFFKKIF